MKASNLPKLSLPSALARAEAAAWVARLHGPNRDAAVEAGWRNWVDESADHAAAFELLTDTWEKSSRLRRRPIEQLASWELPGFRISFSTALFATTAIALCAVIGTVFYLHNDAIATVVGEQRTVTLEDGTRVYLNTDTRAVVHYDKRARRVELDRGEALFEVAKRPDWPFIVTAAHRHIRALGTAFVVRSDDEHLTVTLVEGKVTVSSGASAAAATATTSAVEGSHATFTLAPGQRLIFAKNGLPTMDQPALERVTAWKRGQVSLDNTRLADAVGEMNRYSRIHLVIQDARTAAIPISGTFQAGDSEDFARAIVRTYHLELRARGGELVLAGPPNEP